MELPRDVQDADLHTGDIPRAIQTSDRRRDPLCRALTYPSRSSIGV